MKFHPLSEIFPLIEGEELDQLIESIRKNGQQLPILLSMDGAIVDGRNRYFACKKLKIEPKYETWDGNGSLVEMVTSLNMRRRHLDKSQRSMIAAELRAQFEKEADFRRRANLKSAKSADGPNSAGVAASRQGRSSARAAEIMGVGVSSVKVGAKVLKRAVPEVVQAVKSGKISLNIAEKIAQHPEEEQRSLVVQNKNDLKKSLRDEGSFTRDQKEFKNVLSKIKLMYGSLLYLVNNDVKFHGVKPSMDISEMAEVHKLLGKFITNNIHK